MNSVPVGSPNDREFGAGPGMFKNVIQGSAATLVTVTITACTAVYAASQYADGLPFSATLIVAAKGAGVALAIGTGIFYVTKEA